MRRDSPAGLAVRQRLGILDRGLEERLDTDAENLHRVRVATRRLREALPLIVPTEESRPALTDLAQVARDATRALGDVREMDVALTIMDALVTERPDLQPILDVVRASMASERVERLERMRRRLDAHRLQTATRSIAEGLEESLDDTRAAALLADRLIGRIDEVRNAVEEAGLLYAPERLHRIRLAVKKLRYALELADDMRAASTKRLVTDLKRTQDRLGLLHDLEIVVQIARRTLGQVRPPETAAATLALLDARIRARHAEYLAHREQLLGVIDRAMIVRERVRRRASRPRRAVGATRRRSVTRHN